MTGSIQRWSVDKSSLLSTLKYKNGYVHRIIEMALSLLPGDSLHPSYSETVNRPICCALAMRQSSICVICTILNGPASHWLHNALLLTSMHNNFFFSLVKPTQTRPVRPKALPEWPKHDLWQMQTDYIETTEADFPVIILQKSCGAGKFQILSMLCLGV